MKRYRVLNFDFDTRVQTLVDPINEEWEEKVKELHLQNRQKMEYLTKCTFPEIVDTPKD